MKTVDFGLYVYDLLSIGRSVPGHRRCPDEALQEMPGLRRLASRAPSFTTTRRLPMWNGWWWRTRWRPLRRRPVETHTVVEKVLLERNHVTGVEVRNVRTGARSIRHATAIINAAGPWVDRVLAAAGRPLPRFLGPTRGTHIVVRPFPGLAGIACYAEAQSDGRPFFILPWNGLVLIGTTDTRCDDEPATLRASEPEIAYLLDETHRTFPSCGSPPSPCSTPTAASARCRARASGKPRRSPAATSSGITAAPPAA